MTQVNRRLFLAAATALPIAGIAACSTSDEAGKGAPPQGQANTSPDPTADAFAAQRVVPVLRDASPELALATARAWISGGCSVIELTTSTPDVFSAVATLADEGIYVGVGTMHSASQVDEAADAGAKFVLSFATYPELITQAFSRGITPIPGTMTPTEVYNSLAAPVIKIFPASIVGIDFVTYMKLFFPGIRTQVTGGVGSTPDETAEWLRAGATAVGVSGDVCGRVAELGEATVRDNVREYLARVQELVPQVA